MGECESGVAGTLMVAYLRWCPGNSVLQRCGRGSRMKRSLYWCRNYTIAGKLKSQVSLRRGVIRILDALGDVESIEVGFQVERTAYLCL